MKILLLILMFIGLPASELLYDEHCVSCHFKQQITFEQMKAQKQHLKAPPISVVMERVKEFIVIKVDDEDVQKAVITAFMKDYIMEPSIDKGICHVNCYVQFGTMPSQKELIEPEELDEIVSWVYDNY